MSAEIADIFFHAESVSELVRAAQHGERPAFDRLVELHQEAVEATVGRYLKNRVDVEEVRQEVLLQAWRKIRQCAEPERFSGWLMRIAANTAINKTRRSPRNRERQGLKNAANLSATEPTPLGDLLAREKRALIQTALERLSERDRELLTAIYMEDRSQRDIAEHFDRPLGTIKRWAHDARNQFKELVSDLPLGHDKSVSPRCREPSAKLPWKSWTSVLVIGSDRLVASCS